MTAVLGGCPSRGKSAVNRLEKLAIVAGFS